MSSYATVGSNRLEDAKRFYDALLGQLGMSAMLEHPTGGRLYASPDGRIFGVLAPFDGDKATIGNGTMVGFVQPNRAAVASFHAKVLSLGGTCEGPPGFRGPEELGYYLAYVRDLDGNKLCAYHFGPDSAAS